jgi:hypothetical protein
MDGQGGGVTPHKNCEVYVDLIVGDLSGVENEYARVADLFRAFAKHEQGEANFGYAEITKDKRLYEALSKTEAGKQFYMTLLQKMPFSAMPVDSGAKCNGFMRTGYARLCQAL